MPSLGFGEILVIALIALIVFGPKRLPEIGRTVGKGLREFRRATTDLRSEIERDIDPDTDPPTVPSAWERARAGRRGAEVAVEGSTETEPDEPGPGEPEQGAPKDE